MTHELILALALFAFATSITPGPNNLMLMASGANFGFRRTLPHMLGIGIGFTAMIVLVGYGLNNALATYPVIELALRAACLVFLLYLAWRTATAGEASRTGHAPRPLNFWQAAAFQWVNPKSWAMALTALSVYAPDRSMQSVLAVALIFGAINLPSVSTWTVLGQALSAWLDNPIRRRNFNWVMATLLIASMVPMLLS